ncbi:hypothetical protein [Streptomyces microflavus]|uniref:hypothetical protein n=1 Tax=Streptomyces microflavus TaxID=1919 RepID=UPI002E34828B|nr:hypothetical protein [Streptomyces microflavus]
MTQPTALPLTVERLADRLLAPGVNEAVLTAELTAVVGARPARRLLAGAHRIAADRLFTEAA